MELIKISVYAKGKHSGRIYQESVWVKKSSLDSLYGCIPETIFCGWLDEKYEKVMGKVYRGTSFDTKDDLSFVLEEEKQDGARLISFLWTLYEKHGLDWLAEQKEIQKALEEFQNQETLTVTVPVANRKELENYIKSLGGTIQY